MVGDTRRVLICTPTYYLQGGVERILESLATHLPSRGFDVVFALAKGRRFHDPAAFRRAFPIVRGIEIDGTRGTAYGRRRALAEAIEKVDPHIVLNARMFDAYPVCAALKYRGSTIRYAVTIQAHEEDYFLDVERYREFVDLCVASGALIADEARRRGVEAGRIRNVPGGVRPPIRNAQRTGGPLRIGYAGRLEQAQKRILDLPLLLRELERRGITFTCDVVGDGSVAETLRTAAPGARFHGWLESEVLYDRIYPELDVFVHFAEWEGVTIAPREAMAHGVVPVVSRFRGLEEEGQFVDGQNALTFPVGDVQAAAEAIERLHRDQALFERLSSSARGSQGGVRSEQGAADAWAAAFRASLEMPVKTGKTLPAPPRDSGRLTRLGLPDAVSELVRRLRSLPAGGPGDEWPHAEGRQR